MVPIEKLTVLPVLPVNQFRVDSGDDGWAFTRTETRVYGISGPAPGGQGVLCLTLPEQIPFMGCENRLWRLEAWRGVFPAYDRDDPQNVDVGLATIAMLVPAPARTAMLQLHDGYILELEGVLRSAIDYTTDNLAELEDDDDLIRAARVLSATARGYGLDQTVAVLDRARQERAAALKLSLDGLPSRW